MDRLSRTFNFDTPIGGLVLAALVGLALILAVSLLGLRFDPFDLTAKRADRAEALAVSVADTTDARTIEAAGAADVVRRTDDAARLIRAGDAIAHQSALAAQDAPDATALLASDRRDRLRHADDQLCGLRPSLCAAASAPDAAPGRRTVPPVPPA